jgi:hypothetical protein
MATVRSRLRDPVGIGILGGIVCAAAVLVWMFSRAVCFSPGDPGTVVAGLGYSVGGLVLVAAVPLYLLVRELYGTHLHSLTSYLTVWPLLFGIAVVGGLVEAPIRVATDGSSVGAVSDHSSECLASGTVDCLRTRCPARTPRTP